MILIVDVTVQSHSGYAYMEFVPGEGLIVIRALLNRIHRTASERRGINVKRLKDLYLKSKAMIRPPLSYI